MSKKKRMQLVVVYLGNALYSKSLKTGDGRTYVGNYPNGAYTRDLTFGKYEEIRANLYEGYYD